MSLPNPNLYQRCENIFKSQLSINLHGTCLANNLANNTNKRRFYIYTNMGVNPRPAWMLTQNQYRATLSPSGLYYLPGPYYLPGRYCCSVLVILVNEIMRSGAITVKFNNFCYLGRKFREKRIRFLGGCVSLNLI